MELLITVILISLGVSFICSISEAVFLSINQGYVEVLKEKRPKVGSLLEKFRRQIDEPIAAILTLNTIANTIGASFAGAIVISLFGNAYLAIFSGCLTLAILIFGEIIPKTIGARFWRELAPYVTLLLKLLIFIVKPLLVPLALLNRAITPKKKNDVTVSRADLAVLAEIGKREGTLDDQEWQMVKNVIRLSEIRVREIMTPRPDIVAIPVDSTISQAKKVMLDEGHFRLPVYEGSIDSIVGIVVARDLLKAELNGETDIKSVIREPYFVPDSKLIEDLSQEMRKQKIKIAIAVDEFGGTAGIVSLEDLVEEIVGEIQDEHDNEPEQFKTLPDGTIKISGFVPLTDVNERLNLDLPVDKYDTLGGFIFGELGRIPTVGDTVATDKGMFTVSSMNERRVNRVFFSPMKPNTESVS